jgi:hypothetical protein
MLVSWILAMIFGVMVFLIASNRSIAPVHVMLCRILNLFESVHKVWKHANIRH